MQGIISRVKTKIQKINNDLQNSKGLSLKEIEIAIKLKLIAPDQAYYWTEEWQKDIRASEKEMLAGETIGPFDSVNELFDSLN